MTQSQALQHILARLTSMAHDIPSDYWAELRREELVEVLEAAVGVVGFHALISAQVMGIPFDEWLCRQGLLLASADDGA